VNHNYQRDEVPVVIKEIISNFDYHKVNPIKCAYRDGNYYAFDGQNTAIGLTMLFGGKYMAPVMIYNDLETVDDEAQLFEEINAKKYRKAITVADEWKSRLFRADEAPMAILKILRTNGLELANEANKGKSGVIPASLFKTMESLYQSYGETIFTETMSIFAGAWKYDKEAYRKPIIMGLAKFVEEYRGEYIKRGLIDRLNRKGAKDIFLAGLLQSERGYKKYAREILAVYNLNTSTNRLTDKL
jgi:hypothetical protein